MSVVKCVLSRQKTGLLSNEQYAKNMQLMLSIMVKRRLEPSDRIAVSFYDVIDNSIMLQILLLLLVIMGRAIGSLR